MLIRLQKYFSEKGLLSRRQTEEYIKKGWILVNDQVVTELGTRVDPELDKVTLAAEAEAKKASYQYWAFHKPQGIVTNCPQADEQEIRDILPANMKEVYPVGRLDKDSEGLILLTNDGVFAKSFLTAKKQHPRIYEVYLEQKLTTSQKYKIRNGMVLFGQKTLPTDLKMQTASILQLTIFEGKNRQVRRIFQKVGNKVIRLIRVQIGSIKLKGLKIGQFRELTTEEVAAFL